MKNIKTEFKELINGSTHQGSHGVIGTNSVERAIFWEKFRNHYKNGLTIKIKGIPIKMIANHSLSGKSTHFWGRITKEQYEKILGSSFGLTKTKEPSVSIMNGVVEIHAGGNFYQKLPNKDVVII